MTKVCRVIYCMATVVVLLGLIAVADTQGYSPMVRTSCGWIQGQYDNATHIHSFKGIPFAQPPVGPLRWRRPVPICPSTSWRHVYNATRYPPACAQMSGNTVEGSEDCLYLNVFTPTLRPRYLTPVMVYIHGGYLQWASSSFPGYTPNEEIAKKLGVVLVSIQYRLTSFGFLVLDVLGGKGNYGLWDQIEALKWVRHNIRQFGGNPNQVTLFGQSAGGTSALALLGSPFAKGLFHKVWMISGSPLMNAPIQQAREYNKFFLNKTGCSNAHCLRRLDTLTVLRATYPEWSVEWISMDLPRKGVFEPALIVVEGELLPKPPFEMWEENNPNISYVPVLIGVTAQEIDVAPTPNVKTMTKEDITRYIAERLDTFGGNITNRAMELYNYTYEFDAEYIFTTIASDIRAVCGNIVMAEAAMQALGRNVYIYIVTSFPSFESDLTGFKPKYAFHVWDLYAFFNTYRHLGIKNPTQSDLAFGNILRDNVMHFVHHGRPADNNWKPFITNTTALISDNMEYTDIYHKEECKFWNDNGFFAYSWIS